MRLVEFAGYIESKRDLDSVSNSIDGRLAFDLFLFQRHHLLHVSQEAGTDMKPEVSVNARQRSRQSLSLQRIKVSQIIDLFPMLKDLYDKGPQDSFYVVKVWVRIRSSQKTNTSLLSLSLFRST